MNKEELIQEIMYLNEQVERQIDSLAITLTCLKGRKEELKLLEKEGDKSE